MTNPTWSQLKQILNRDSNAGYTWFQDDNSYTVVAVSNSVELITIISISSTPSSDQLDFETNYKNSVNQVPVSTIMPKPFIDNYASGTFTGVGQSIQIDTVGCSTVQYATNGTWSGTLISEISYDNGATWFSAATADTDPLTNLIMLTWGEPAAPNFDNDPWEVNVSGTTLFRLRVVDYASGSLSVTIVSSAAASDIAQPSSDRWAAGTVGALNANLVNATSGCSTCTVAVKGTWVGSIKLQATIDNVNYFDVPFVDISTGLQVLAITANGNYMTPCGGYNQINAVMSAYTSGTATVVMDASEGSNSGVFPVDVPTKYDRLTGNSTTTIKSGVGRLYSICVSNNNTGGIVTIYDNTAGSGTIMMKLVLGTPSGGLLSTSGQVGPEFMGPFGNNGLTFSTGLTVVMSGSTNNDITVIYQ